MAFFVNLNGKLINENKATVSINNRSFRYGDGCFETIRINDGKIALWPYHWQRLQTTLQILNFQLPSFFTADQLLTQVIELAQKNNHQKSGRIRLTVFRGNGGLYDPENHSPNYVIQTWALNDSTLQLNSNGLICGLYDEGYKTADKFSNIKSNNFLLYAMAAMYTKQQHWNEAVLLNHKGSIADATIANMFIIKNEQIITPPLTDGPVAGTMRRFLLEYGENAGFEVMEKSIYPNDMLAADECFVTNAVYGIKWVKSFADKDLGCKQSALLYSKLILPLWQNEMNIK